MESSEVKSTAITNDYKRNRVIFILLSMVYSIISFVVLFKYRLWGFAALACVAMPLFYFLHKWAFTISGYCPYCSGLVAKATEDSLLDCSACGGSIIARDGRLWQRIEGASQSEALKLPPGMSMDEFIDRKRRYKKQAWIVYGLTILLLIAFFSITGWLSGGDKPIEIKKMEDLKMVQGIYAAEQICSFGNRGCFYGAVIRDEQNGKVLFKGRTVVGSISKSWSIRSSQGDFNGKPARVWYARTRSEDPLSLFLSIYQLEVDGKRIFSLEDSNKIAREENDEEHLWTITKLIIFALLSSIVGLAFYSERMKWLIGKKDNDIFS
jgi:hypothetical protein